MCIRDRKKGWDAVNGLIKTSKEKDTISITLNGAKVFPATVLSEIKGGDDVQLDACFFGNARNKLGAVGSVTDGCGSNGNGFVSLIN